MCSAGRGNNQNCSKGLAGPLIPKPVKKLEKLFIAPKVRQVLYETSQRVFTRCACARRTGFLIKFLIKNQYQSPSVTPLPEGEPSKSGASGEASLLFMGPPG